LQSLSITSSAFKNSELIPKKYTGDGEDINPPINIKGIPDGTKSLVLIVDDPDAPMGTWIHWVMWNIQTRNRIDEDSAPGAQGRNSWDKNSYGGPDPPSGTHRYFFKVYALDTTLNLEKTATKNDVEKAMKEHILAKGELVGLYHR
jgi:Raf kinase inhibitor-like YbhB/YbcL family protein